MVVRLTTRKAHELKESMLPRITYMLLFGTVYIISSTGSIGWEIVNECCLISPFICTSFSAEVDIVSGDIIMIKVFIAPWKLLVN